MRVRFQRFCFDSERRQLTRDDEPLHLTPKAFDLLGHLLGRRPNAISQSDLFDLLWPESLVDDSRIHQLIQEIRAALSDDERHVIRTVYGRGYSFALPAVSVDEVTPSLCQLVVGSRHFDLHQGENLIGRDYRSAVRMDEPSVSRRHAVIIVERDGATIEDLGSRNGTFVGGRRIHAAALANTDAITFGSVGAIFYVMPLPASTESSER